MCCTYMPRLPLCCQTSLLARTMAARGQTGSKRACVDPLAQQSSRRTPSTLSSTSSSHGFQGVTSQPSSPPAPFTGHGREPVLGVATVRQLPHFHGRSWLSPASSSDGYACRDPRPASRVPQVTDNGSSMLRSSLLDHQYGVHFPTLQHDI